MSAFVNCTYTPPPPTKPSESSRSMLEAIDHPIAATPLPPSPIAQTQRPRSSSSGKTLTSLSTTPSQQQQQEQHHLQQHQPPQIRYCYFISASAASASTSISRNPSLSRKAIYLSPHVQDPMDASPNCTQPRSRASREPASSAFILGPNPPQIQLQFLEDEPLPPPSTTELIHSTETDSQQKQSSDAVLVERKDSGYGGSVSRSSSLAAFGRGIRKVFWRTSSKGSVESIMVTEPPVLDCDIPQDVLDLDHEGWAQDLAQRLTLASGPDDIANWLGQLPADVALLADGTSTDDVPSEGTLNVLSLSEGTVSAESLQEMIEEFIFMAPRPVEAIAAPTPTIALFDDFNVLTVIPPSAPSTPSPSTPTPVEKTTEKSLRPVLSIEQLNKPQPPLPAITFEHKPVPATPAQAGRTSGGSSPLSTLARKFTLATDFGRGKNASCKRSTLLPNQRNSVQQHFQHAASEASLSQPIRASRDRRLSGNNMETLLDERLVSPSSLVMSPDEEEPEGDSYVTAKSNAKKSNRFFKSLTTSSVAELKKRQNEVRPLSEVLLSDYNLSPEEISAEIVTASRSTSLRSPAMRRAIPKWDETSSQDSASATQEEKGQDSFALAPPMPLFYKSTAPSASSLGESSSCGSVESSADEWEGPSQMTKHALEQNARYNADLKGLQDLLYQGRSRPQSTPAHSNNTSTGSLVLPSVPSSPSRRDTKSAKGASKKDDYMSHRMSACSPKLLPVTDKNKSRPKSRLSMTYGGGELETVKPAKFDTPEAIARNKEIRKFISQEIYTTELNYLQYLRTIQEMFVDPLFQSLESDKPFIPRANPLYQLLAHISTLTAVASQIAQNLEDCVRDEVWSDELSMIGTIFLDIKEPLSIFLKYGQSYGKGMKALRTLMKSKRASIAIAPASTTSTATNTPASTLSSGSNTLTVPGGPRLDKRRSLPSIFALNGTSPHQSLMVSSWSTVSNGSTNSTTPASSSKSKNGAKPRSSHGMMTTGSSRDSIEFEIFLRNCVGGKETTSRFSLADLMILPIQRVTRYCLLLKDLKRHTAVEHPDYICLVHALEQLHTLALATNNVQPSSLRL